MELEYPYQLVAFLDDEPKIGESVYGGKNDWYPQIALKRRFKIVDLNQDEMFDKISSFVASFDPLVIQSKTLIKPEHMPVHVIEVEYTEQLKDFHLGFIATFGDHLVSRYPERDGEHYYPHITAEFWNRLVIDSEKYSNQSFNITRVCLLKDAENEDSQAYKYFDLG